MTKSLEVRPETVFKKGSISFEDIPVNQYDRPIGAAAKELGAPELVRIFRDMQIIREFETSLDQIKKEGVYQGLTYSHKGPAHLSIGQEATAVGEAYHLDVDDHIYGSHRSHGEILAKGLRSIELLGDAELERIMRGYLGGITLRAVEAGQAGSVKDLARRFLIYGAYAEIFARVTGFNRGLGGSMHAFFLPFGIYPNNAIVGGSATITAGAALFKRVNRKKGIVVCNIGDASFGCGPVWEAICFSAMDQYRTLWDKELGGAPPLLFAGINNHYGMGGQTCGETMGYQFLARVGAGVNPDQMHAERVNGYDPLAVMDAVKRKKEVLLAGRGPALLDIVTYRISGHSPSDASSYRSKEEIDAWTEADAIRAYARKLVGAKIATQAQIDQVVQQVREETLDLCTRAADLSVGGRMPENSEEIGEYMFSNGKVEKFDDRPVDVLMPMAENPRVKQLAGKIRTATVDGKPVPKLKMFSLRDALFEAIIDRFYKDPTLVAFGEEVRDWGGAFAVYRGLTEALPYHRLFNSPISEAAVVGACVGYAIEGGRAIGELMYCDFLGRAGDETFNQLSKWQAMSGGMLRMPVVLRISVGAKYGAQHSQDWTALVAHVPGLKAVFPVTPYDAKGMMNAALNGTDPVVFFESQSVYDVGEQFVAGGVPEGYYEVPLGEPAVRRTGSDLTLVTLGPALYMALAAADELKKTYGMSAEVVDLRCINPLNYAPLVDSVKKTGRAVLVTEACERGSFMHTVAENITQLAFDYLDAPPAIVGSRNWITPAAELETMFFPQVSWILDTIHERVVPLPKHVPTTSQTNGEIVRRNRLGV